MGANISAPPFNKLRARILIGTYVGNGVDNRNLDIGINLAAKSNVYIIIKGGGSYETICRTEYGQGDLTMHITAISDSADMIQALTSTGFQLGTNVICNQNTITYRYIVFYEE